MAGLKDIIGNQQLVEHFTKAIENDKVNHAYIISGEKGMGKRTLAKAFAMTLLCEEGGTEPCMKCHSCIQAMSDNNPDIINIYKDEDKATNVIGVDNIRDNFVNDIGIKPYSYKHKVYIINDAECLNVQAQNTMLKTIEEPPEYAVILILTNNAQSFLQTVLSRCVVMNMLPLKKEEIKNYLMKKEKVVDYQAEVAVSMAGGNLGKAREMAVSQDFADMMQEVLDLLKYIDEMKAYEVVAAVKRATNYKRSFDDYIDLMMLWFRDVLLYKASKDANSLIFKNSISVIQKHASKASYNGIQEILDAMNKAKVRLKANVNFDTAIELMYLTIRDNI